MNNTVILNGLVWDKENLVVDGRTHFNYDEAQKEAFKLGKRLPSKEEFTKLFRLQHEWDNDKNGMWFAEKEEDLKGEKSLFLPAAGSRIYCDSTMGGVDIMSGYYWSDDSIGSIHAHYLVFNNFHAFISNSLRGYGSSVRCVSNIK